MQSLCFVVYDSYLGDCRFKFCSLDRTCTNAPKIFIKFYQHSMEYFGGVTKLNHDYALQFSNQIVLMTKSHELSGGKKSVKWSKDTLLLRTQNGLKPNKREKKWEYDNKWPKNTNNVRRKEQEQWRNKYNLLLLSLSSSSSSSNFSASAGKHSPILGYIIKSYRLEVLVCILNISYNWTCSKNYRFLHLYVPIQMQVKSF
jgi:hypothetical protein